MTRIIDWLCARFGLCIDFSGDLMTPDVPDGDGDPHYRRPPQPRKSGMYYTPERIADCATGTGSFLGDVASNPPFTTPRQHAARLKGKRQ